MRPTARTLATLLLTLSGCEKAATSGKTQPREEIQPQKPQQGEKKWHLATGALDQNCDHSGKNPDGGYQFIIGCPVTVTSPDGEWKLLLGKETPESFAPVTVLRSDGSVVASVSALADGMPFVLYWLPRPNWFLVNHHVGSFMDRPEVYEIAGGRVILHDLTAGAAKEAKRISPCLRRVKWNFVQGDAVGWSNDGKRIAWYFETRPDACMGPDEFGPVPPNEWWKSFWMISDAETGAVLADSIRIIPDDKPAHFPDDKLYAEYHPGRR